MQRGKADQLWMELKDKSDQRDFSWYIDYTRDMLQKKRETDQTQSEDWQEYIQQKKQIYSATYY